MRLRMIGFWRSAWPGDASLPDPRELIDPSWDERERAEIAHYLATARRVREQMGKSACRLCGECVGNAEGTDGTYLWPEGFAHYVAEHAIRPPEERTLGRHMQKR